MYFTDRGIEELQRRRGDEEVTFAWLAEQLQAFVDVHPDFETAMACYRSPEYQANIKVRQPHAVADLIIIEGYDGPQPG